MIPSSQYVEIRNPGCYVAGTRIGLDIIVREFRDGRSPEEIFEAYPSIGSLAKTYGVLTFILEHAGDVDSYLKEQDERWEDFKSSHPLPRGMSERFERAKRDLPIGA